MEVSQVVVSMAVARATMAEAGEGEAEKAAVMAEVVPGSEAAVASTAVRLQGAALSTPPVGRPRLLVSRGESMRNRDPGGQRALRSLRLQPPHSSLGRSRR